MYKLKISEYPSIQDAFNAIPAGVTSLNLSHNDLGTQSGPDLKTVLLGIPAGVTSLNLSNNLLTIKSEDDLAAALSVIPGSVTCLNLSNNYLGRLSGADLATVLAGIPESVKSLDLYMNRLNEMSGADLKTALSGIPKSVTSLGLGDNHLDEISGADLKTVLSGIPAGVTSLDFRYNHLGLISEAISVTLLDSIPNTVKEVRVAQDLAYKSKPYLKKAFSGLHRNGITISFKGALIFTPGNREANDALLQKLRSAAAGRSLCLTNTGESDFSRGLSTLVGIGKKTVKGQIFPDDMVKYIASFLVLAHRKQDLDKLFSSDVMAQVMVRKTKNTNQEACIINSTDLSEVRLSNSIFPRLQTIFKKMPKHISKVVRPFCKQ